MRKIGPRRWLIRSTGCALWEPLCSSAARVSCAPLYYAFTNTRPQRVFHPSWVESSRGDPRARRRRRRRRWRRAATPTPPPLTLLRAVERVALLRRSPHHVANSVPLGPFAFALLVIVVSLRCPRRSSFLKGRQLLPWLVLLPRRRTDSSLNKLTPIFFTFTLVHFKLLLRLRLRRFPNDPSILSGFPRIFRGIPDYVVGWISRGESRAFPTRVPASR